MIEYPIFESTPQFCVIYRTGGTARFEWHRTLPVFTRGEANEQARLVRNQGFHALVENYKMSVSVGLPDTFSYWEK